MRRGLAFEFLNITEQAALAATPFVGMGDKNRIDKAAVEAIRQSADNLPVKGEVVVGEGENDGAPKFSYGEKLGVGEDKDLDIAIDPIEGTEFAAKNKPNSLAVMAAAPPDNLFTVPDIYMDKLVVGPQAKGKIDLQNNPAENLTAVAEGVGKPVTDLTVVVLDRPRHQKIIEEVRLAGANLKLIDGVEVVEGILAVLEDSEVDVLMGIGGAPEGVLIAAAVKCLGGDMQGQLVPSNAAEVEKAVNLGITDVSQILTLDQLVKGQEVIFSMTGVTNGKLLSGVDGGQTESLLVRRSGKNVWSRKLVTNHSVNKKAG